MKRRQSIAGPVITASLLAGGIGYCAGVRRAPLPLPSAPIVTMLACPGTGTPPAPAREPTAVAEAPKHHTTVAVEKPAGNELPPLAATDDHREQLLQYVRDRAALLQDCVPGGHERLRLTLRVDVGGQGSIQQVHVVEGDPEAVHAGECVATRMKSWTLPAEWVQARQSLLMSVVL